ncbi:MAG TPA: T9SS type A sorting domain-containing protein [Candidatus Marinimicrobia bacterium]|nr:T9SS type A sorting domain-containing protein [Candidatus Neomarinimicrobiota bacterium]
MKKPAILILLLNIVFSQGYVRDVSPFTVTFDGEEIFQPFSGGLNQPDPRFIDWNGDGILDCFINDRDGYLQYWEGVADWQFGNIPLFTFVTKTFQDINVGTWFAFHDFDGDGDEDLLSHTPDSDNVSYWSNENGEFELVADELLDIDNLPVYGGQIVIPAIADIDGDGHIDYFIGDISGRLAYYKGYGMSAGLPLFELITSTFEDIQIVWTPSRHGANAVEFYDMDNDNDLDLIWGDFYQPGLFYLENYGTSTNPDFDDSLMVTDFPQGTDFVTTGHNIARVVDFDLDGDGDMVVGVLSGAYGTEYLNNLYYFKNNGTAENWNFEMVTSRLLPGLDFISGTHPTLTTNCNSNAVEIWIGTDSDSANLNWNGSIYYLNNNGSAAEPALVGDGVKWFTQIGNNLVPAFFNFNNDGGEELFVGEFNGKLYKIDQYQDYPLFCIFGDPEADFLNIDLSGRATPSFGDIDQDDDDDLAVGDKNGVIHIYWNQGSADSAVFDSMSYLNIDIGDNASPCVLENGHIIAGNEEGELYEITYLDSEELTAELRTDIPYMGRNLAPAALYWDGESEPDLVFGTHAGGLQYFRYDSTSVGIEEDFLPTSFTVSQPYPNPFNNQFSITIILEKRQMVDVQLIDIIGRNVQNIFNGELSIGKRNFSIKTDLPTGIYFLKIHTNERLLIRKIVLLK